MRGAVLLLMAVAANCAAQSLADFAGTWVQKHQGRNLRVLTLRLHDGAMTGSMARPRQMTTDGEGDYFDISAESRRDPVTGLKLSGNALEFVCDDDPYSMTLTGTGQATLLPIDQYFPRPGWKLERTSDANATVATSWPIPTYSKEILDLQERLKQMVKVDQAPRTGDTISHEKLAAIDAAHRAEVLRIHEKYGWPTFSLAGKEASHNYWLLVQHQDLEVHRLILPDLEHAVSRGEASKSSYAYLFDRVQVYSGKPQHWGTQTSCKDGKAELDPVDDPAGLELRRKDLFMIPMDRYLKEMSDICAAVMAR
jgi:hypothetical protein